MMQASWIVNVLVFIKYHSKERTYLEDISIFSDCILVYTIG